LAEPGYEVARWQDRAHAGGKFRDRRLRAPCADRPRADSGPSRRRVLPGDQDQAGPLHAGDRPDRPGAEVDLAMTAQAPPRQDAPGLVVGSRDQPALADLTWHPSRPAHHLAFIWMLGCLSAAAIWLLLYAFVLSGFQEAGAQHALYAALRTQMAQGIAPIGG